MFGVLLETRAERQRRNGSAILSGVVHAAIIASIAMGASARRPAQAKSAGPTEQPVFITRVTTDPAIAPPHEGPMLPRILPVIRVPDIVPRGLPPIIPNTMPVTDAKDVIFGSVDRAGAMPRGVLDLGAAQVDATDWNGSEALMRMRVSAPPRYPEMLRRAGVTGRVVLRFAVDTAGRVDLGSVQVVESTHDAFTRAVRDILPRLRFEPARVHGRAVAALAEMPFEFVLRQD